MTRLIALLVAWFGKWDEEEVFKGQLTAIAAGAASF
jgi:hypothetical protein